MRIGTLLRLLPRFWLLNGPLLDVLNHVRRLFS
jgi:hypothetical protein